MSSGRIAEAYEASLDGKGLGMQLWPSSFSAARTPATAKRRSTERMNVVSEDCVQICVMNLLYWPPRMRCSVDQMSLVTALYTLVDTRNGLQGQQ